jgi:hypothetical protein
MLAEGAALPPLEGSTTVLENGYQAWSPTAVKQLETGRPVTSSCVTAIHGRARSVVIGFASNVVGINSIRVEQTSVGVAVSDRSEYRRLPISAFGDGTPLDALYLSWGNSPSEMLAQYAAATKVFTNVMDPAPDVPQTPAPGP